MNRKRHSIPGDSNYQGSRSVAGMSIAFINLLSLVVVVVVSLTLSSALSRLVS